MDNADKGFRSFNRNRSDFDNRPHKGNRECIYCREKGHTSLIECDKFKVVSPSKFFVLAMLMYGHRAYPCRKNIKACNKFLHCKLVCTCNYDGKKINSGALAVQRSLHSPCE